MALLVASKAAIYSASIKNQATVVYVFENQEMEQSAKIAI